MGVTSSYAGTLTIGYGDTETAAIIWSAPTFASEYFLNSPSQVVPDGGTIGTQDSIGADNLIETNDPTHSNNGDGKPDPTSLDTFNDRYLYAKYEMDSTVSANFLAKFELSNGAQLGESLSLGSTTDMDFRAGVSSTAVPTTFSTTFGPGGDVGDTQVTFLVQAASGDTVRTTDHLLLRFKLKGLTALATPGGKVDMTVSIFDTSGTIQIDNQTSAHAPTATVVQSARGAAINLEASTGIAQVDVTTGSLKFTGDIAGNIMKAKLGTLEIDSPKTAIKADGSKWTFGADDPKPSSATLTIVDGNFSASMSGSGRVFIDLDSNDTFDTGSDLIASVDADGSTATWNLSVDNLDAIRKETGGVPIVIEADGSTEINEAKEAPLATLSLDYGAGTKDTVSSKLRQIKRNGTVCTLYNVPNPNATDTGNIRVTNTSGQATKIRGTLRSLDGTEIFINKVLVETVIPNQTVRLTQDDLDKIEKNPAWLTAWQADTARNPTGGENGWPGRAVLAVSGEVSDMEVFGLVRNKLGGPLTNMSVGGTGNACD
jgi:hypothetical protein